MNVVMNRASCTNVDR